MDVLFWVCFGLVYFLIGVSLFIVNFFVFRKFSGLEVDKEILEDHNNALASVIRWQLIWQAIMIGTLIYFLGTTLDKVLVDGKIIFNNFLVNVADIIAFWLIGIVVFQLTIYCIWKIVSLEKEILIDQNESLGKIIEWLLIALSIILSLSIYSY